MTERTELLDFGIYGLFCRPNRSIEFLTDLNRPDKTNLQNVSADLNEQNQAENGKFYFAFKHKKSLQIDRTKFINC